MVGVTGVRSRRVTAAGGAVLLALGLLPTDEPRGQIECVAARE